MNVSQFVYKTSDKLYHSITKKSLPLIATEKELRDSMFYEDQNIESIRARLSTPPYYLSINLIPTWECNFRCTHCCVISSLKKTDENSIDSEKLYNFLDAYLEKFPTVKNFQGYFLGGESLLKPQKVLELMGVFEKAQEKHKRNLVFGITTNLGMELTEDHYKIFDKLDNIAVSLDGLEEEHNAQRKGFIIKGQNTFTPVVENFKKLVERGYRDKIFVQAALKDELLEDKDYLFRYMKFLITLGIKMERITVGSIFPTVANPEPSSMWLNNRKFNLNLDSRPCCKYRFMSTFKVDSDNTLYDNFYTNENSKLGMLGDDIESICKVNLDLIFNKMPAMKDKNCRSCPALGYCWGGCISSHVLIKDRPSSCCKREVLIPHIKDLADKNQLISKG